jgi:hypothetical protein
MTERITNRQLDRITTWLEQKTRGTCPFCGGVQRGVTSRGRSGHGRGRAIGARSV